MQKYAIGTTIRFFDDQAPDGVGEWITAKITDYDPEDGIYIVEDLNDDCGFGIDESMMFLDQDPDVDDMKNI